MAIKPWKAETRLSDQAAVAFLEVLAKHHDDAGRQPQDIPSRNEVSSA